MPAERQRLDSETSNRSDSSAPPLLPADFSGSHGRTPTRPNNFKGMAIDGLCPGYKAPSPPTFIYQETIKETPEIKVDLDVDDTSDKADEQAKHCIINFNTENSKSSASQSCTSLTCTTYKPTTFSHSRKWKSFSEVDNIDKQSSTKRRKRIKSESSYAELEPCLKDSDIDRHGKRVKASTGTYSRPRLTPVKAKTRANKSNEPTFRFENKCNVTDNTCEVDSSDQSQEFPPVFELHDDTPRHLNETVAIRKEDDIEGKYDSVKAIADPEEYEQPSRIREVDIAEDDHSVSISEPEHVRLEKKCTCSECKGKYRELYNRMDALIHDFQWINHRTCNQSSDLSKLKRWARRFTISVVAVVIFLVCCNVTSVAAVGKLLCSGSRFTREIEWNITSGIASLQTDFSSVTTMVNKLMTRSRSVLKVTSDNKLIPVGDGYHLQWTTEGHSGQGNLRLSSAGDSVVVGTSGYYMVMASLFYNAALNGTEKVRLRYDIVQQKADESHITIRDLPPGQGPLKLELSTQTTMHLTFGEQLLISIKSEQQRHISVVPGAHQLTLIEVT